ncbi:multicopper oxidase domain-containing protein [Turicibacter sanguinis]|nr:multicopper oxidase domain-containing protein [Turicibacter sanguinis]
MNENHIDKRSTNLKCKPPYIDPSNPDSIPKYIDRLPIPKKAAREICTETYDAYRITMKEAFHTFHSYFPKTKVWGYNGKYPGPTIEAFKDRITYIRWENKLPEKHILPYDYMLHGTIDTPEVKTVVHVHGAHVEPESDGHPEAWFTQDYALRGPHFTKRVYQYTNHQPFTMLWYHDHAMGSTRLNVYAGLAGLYLIRDELEERLNLPKGAFEIPIIIQDKSFNPDGSLLYPEPLINPDPPAPITGFLGNTIVVNGNIWPCLEVGPRKYRLRFLNASNERNYDLSFSNDASFYQIGTDGGFIKETNEIKSFKIFPAERIDTIVDFSDYKGKTIILKNNGDDVDSNTAVIMQFKVSSKRSKPDTSEIPTRLNPYDHLTVTDAVTTRTLRLGAKTDSNGNLMLDPDGRLILVLNNRMWHEPTTEIVKSDTIEVWNIINPTPVTHPIHIHLVQFQILSRTSIETGEELPIHSYEQGFKDTVEVPSGTITSVAMHFTGFTGEYVWHCHLLEHEDHDMMRPLRVIEGSLPSRENPIV